MVASEEPGASASATEPAGEAARKRETAFRLVLVGLLILVAGFTAALVANAFYPCEPAAGSTVQPPIGQCVVSLSPWFGIAIVGLLLAAAGYLRVR